MSIVFHLQTNNQPKRMNHTIEQLLLLLLTYITLANISYLCESQYICLFSIFVPSSVLALLAFVHSSIHFPALSYGSSLSVALMYFSVYFITFVFLKSLATLIFIVLFFFLIFFLCSLNFRSSKR